jgi:RNA polymerase sigma-70 factor (ECF subfamily)
MNSVVADSAETQRLLGQVRAGEPGATDRLLARHRPFVYRLVELHLSPKLRARVDPSDVVQETQMEALRRLEQYLEHPSLPFRLWLRQLTWDRLLMLHRRHVKAARRTVDRELGLPEDSSIELAQRLLAGGSTPSQRLIREEFAQRVRQAVSRLPEADREIVMLRNFEGLSNQEAARSLWQVEHCVRLGVVSPTAGTVMSSPTTKPTHDLTGRRFGHWYVMAYAGQRDGTHYWKCRTPLFLIDMVLPEPDIRQRKVDPGRQYQALTGCIFGLWEVLQIAGPRQASSSRKRPMRQCHCRCTCGSERTIKEDDLTCGRTLSCGCQPTEVLQKERGAWRAKVWRSYSRSFPKRPQPPGKWSRAMKRALFRSQPACVLCRAADTLHIHHVRPCTAGGHLEPGNVVRLCAPCNLSVGALEPRDLPPDMRRPIETAAVLFKKWWKGGCVESEIPEMPPPAEWPPPPIDPNLVALLRAMEHDPDATIPALAGWLKERGDPRAAAIRKVTRLKTIVTEAWTEANELVCLVISLDGKVSILQSIQSIYRGDTEADLDEEMLHCLQRARQSRCRGDTKDTLARRVQEERRRHRSAEVWRRLGLTPSGTCALRRHLGFNSGAPEALAGEPRPDIAVEEMVQLGEQQVQTARNRIRMALYRLRTPKRL